jgi:hypothetical protein
MIGFPAIPMIGDSSSFVMCACNPPSWAKGSIGSSFAGAEAASPLRGAHEMHENKAF